VINHDLSNGSLWLPIAFSELRNQANETVLHDLESSVRILRMETDENGWMARAASRYIESECA
jgi:acetate kinase